MDDSAWKEELNHIKINRIFDDFIAKSTLSKIVVFLKDFAYSKMLGKDEKIKYEKSLTVISVKDGRWFQKLVFKK